MGSGKIALMYVRVGMRHGSGVSEIATFKGGGKQCTVNVCICIIVYVFVFICIFVCVAAE